jgi:hypothetical protein
VDLDDRGANDPENPPSTKGMRGRGHATTDHADQVDHRGKAEDSTPIIFRNPRMGEEDEYSTPGDDGYNAYTEPSGRGGKSDRFTR